MKKITMIALVVLAFLFAIGATFFITLREAGSFYADRTAGDVAAAQKTQEIASYLERYFIEEYDDALLGDAAAAAMVAATGDPWSYYLPAEQYAEYEEQMSNSYVGVGVTIVEDAEAGGMRIESVTPEGPAAQADVRIGDILVRVGDMPTLELGMNGTRELVRGEEGTSVQLVFLRDGKEYTVELTRVSIQTQVTHAELLEEDIGYIALYNFDERSSDETLACIEQLLSQGAKAFVFDVRFNGGGMKNEMVEILDRLLPEGVLFRSVDYDGEEETDNSDAVCLQMPMAVLVNDMSYSAAEFFAAALQEYEKAVIVGTQTTGKGNFQTAFRLSDGSLLNISIGKYFTPNGVSLTETGVTPDVTVDVTQEQYVRIYQRQLAPADDPQLQAAITHLREKMS